MSESAPTVSNTESSTTSERKGPTPFFLIEPFDKENADHMRGMITVRFNSKHARDLGRIITETSLEPNEGHIYAMHAGIKRWYDQRADEIRSKKELEEKEAAGAAIFKKE